MCTVIIGMRVVPRGMKAGAVFSIPAAGEQQQPHHARA